MIAPGTIRTASDLVPSLEPIWPLSAARIALASYVCIFAICVVAAAVLCLVRMWRCVRGGDGTKQLES